MGRTGRAAPADRTGRAARGSAARLLMLASACGAFFGFSISSMNQSISRVGTEMALSSLHQGIVVSALVVGAVAGCVAAGALTDRLGRRRVLVLSGVLGAAACAVCAVAPDEASLVAGRFLNGMAVGATSAVAPVLLAELAPARSRGSVITTYQLVLTVGVLAALALGVAWDPGGHWRLLLAANAVLPAVQAVSAALVPQAPGDLLASGRDTAARAVLRATRDEAEAEAEYARLVRVRELPTVGVLHSLHVPGTRLPVAIALGSALMNALVGIGAVVYYSTLVFTAAGVGGSSGAQVASMSIGVVNVAMSVVALGLVRRYGRRSLLTVGLVGMAGALCVAGWGLLAAGGSATGAVTVTAILLYVACFAFSAGPVAWVLMAEVLPEEAAARVAGAALALNWGANLLVALLFPVIVGTPAVPARVGLVFLFFALLCLAFLLLLRRFVPETKDRSLAEVQEELLLRARR
ncbi:sugar porter family MFS transporter [Streptomyces sp. WAC06614]|uniref:sugar porter family MFS transporter n=1 Tax=Streptomyces sp. WAC06614 TaxID=2487416 RepID=UPI000F77A073|nr:sugar porter family MFS transporter [Streptomyces sp. WAC06614]RSS83603.1 MFS transporter [Streptomyces sp. WAC06614]